MNRIIDDKPNKEIRQRAIKARLNLWEVAERAGISEATMCRWMRTELKPADPRRILLLSALAELEAERTGGKDGEEQKPVHES